jgi:hypothetical protein
MLRDSRKRIEIWFDYFEPDESENITDCEERDRITVYDKFPEKSDTVIKLSIF